MGGQELQVPPPQDEHPDDALDLDRVEHHERVDDLLGRSPPYPLHLGGGEVGEPDLVPGSP